MLGDTRLAEGVTAAVQILDLVEIIQYVPLTQATVHLKPHLEVVFEWPCFIKMLQLTAPLVWQAEQAVQTCILGQLDHVPRIG